MTERIFINQIVLNTEYQIRDKLEEWRFKNLKAFLNDYSYLIGADQW